MRCEDRRQGCDFCIDWNLAECDICDWRNCMTAKEWLSRAWGIEKEIRALQEEQKKALTRVITGTSNGGGGSKKTNVNVVEKRLISYAEYSERIDKRIDKLYDTKNEIAAAVGKIPSAELRTLLTRRYLSFEKWEKIAEDMHYSAKWVRTGLHKKALKAADKVIFGDK